jgi:diketogulonate reductase-like aldo/keto reductase
LDRAGALRCDTKAISKLQRTLVTVLHLAATWEALMTHDMAKLFASLLHDPTLVRIGAAHGCSAAAVALAWTIRNGNVIAIPESGSVAHVKENAFAL